MKEATIDGRTINVDYSKPKPEGQDGGAARQNRAKAFGDQISEPSDTLFVGNVAFSATEDMLAEQFGSHGNILGIRLPTDPESGELKGFGYIQYSSVEEAVAAFEACSGAEIAGRPVRLDYSRPRASTGDSPRGRGGFGGRGRGGDRGGRGGGRGFGGGRGGFGGRGRGGDRGGRGGRGGSTNRGGFGDFKGKKMTF